MSITADPKNIKALALDLDGTILAPGAVLSERSLRAVKACVRRGLKLIIATGRAIDAAEPFRLAMGVEGPMIYFNGAMVTDVSRGEIISTTLLDLKTADYCVDLSREMEVYYQVFLPPSPDNPKIKLIAEREGPEREMYHTHTGLYSEIVDLKAALSRPGLKGCIKSMFLAEPETFAAVRQRLDERLGKSVYISQTLRNFLEIMNAGVSKSQGLRTVMERLSLKREEIIAFGDEENDLPMFEAAGFSVAPSNAKENVKTAANLVAGPNTEDGVAVFLEEFFSL